MSTPHPTWLTALILFCTGAAAQQASSSRTPQSPYPRFMPGYSLHGSLAEAVSAARGTQRVVVYTEWSVTLRNRLPWLMQQRAIFTSAATRKALADVPILMTGNTAGDVKELRLPRMGFSVLSPDGKRVLGTIDLSQVGAVKVPPTLYELIHGKPTTLITKDRAAAELKTFRAQHTKILNALDQDDADLAEKLCREEEQRQPNGFGPRLLRETIRAKRIAPSYYKSLPADRPHLDLVCVVPDTATALAMIERWGEGPIFPILHLDSHYLPLFLQAYGPKRIVFAKSPRRDSKKPLDAERAFQTWAKSFGSNARDEKHAVALWKEHQSHAPGVVFTHPESPMFAAGVALAAGRRQLLAMMAPVAAPEKRVSYAGMTKVRDQVRGLFDRNFLAATKLYDDIDFVTLASEQPFRYQDRLDPDKSTRAVDDAIARDRFEMMSACVGRLLGDETQSLYMAMCALFLSPKRPLLFSRYANSGSWAAYGTTPAANLLKQEALPIRNIEHPKATLAAWQTLFEAPVSPFDLVHVNSSGGPRNWSTSSGNGSYDDIPLTVPAIVSYVHSFSLANGYDSDTVAGRWLHNGAYSYFGSVHEPYLDAFVNYYAVLRRAVREGWPLGMAHRLLPMQLRWRPWKLMYVGDPLIRLQFEPVARQAPTRLDGTVELAAAGTRNPFGQAGLDRRVFQLSCLALRGQPATVAKGLDGLLRSAARDKQLTQSTRRAIADLVAWTALTRQKTGELLRWLERSDVDSPRLRYVLHTLAKSRLFAIRSQPRTSGAGAEVERLALAQARLHASAVLFKRIGELYRPVLKALPDGKRRRAAIQSTLRKMLKGRKELGGMIRAL